MAATGASPAARRRAFRGRVTAVESRQTTATSSQQLELAATALATPRPLARLGRAAPVPAPLYGRTAAGNSAVSSDARGEPAAQPGKGAGDGIADASPYGGRVIVTPPSQLNRAARTPASQHGLLIARDRRIAASRGTVMQSGRRDTKPGIPDPDADGPATPGFHQVNRTFSHQVGTDATANLDNPAPKPRTSAGGRAFALGTRGDPQTTRYGGTPGLAALRPYGYRGFPAGAGGPRPKLVALPGGPFKPGTVLAQGDPGDGPQKFPSGPPWGLHTPTLPPYKLTQASQRFRFAQVRPPRLNRPLNSAAQGQSYDQAVVHQDGTVAARIPRLTPGRQPGVQRRRTR